MLEPELVSTLTKYNEEAHMPQENISMVLARPLDAKTIALMSRDEIESGLSWNWTPLKVHQAIVSRSTHVVTAKDGIRLVGFGIMAYSDTNANLNLLAVHKTDRRSGIATRIVNWLEVVAATAGITKLSVQLRASNKTAYCFYKKLGYFKIDEVSGYYQHKESALIMRKRLM